MFMLIWLLSFQIQNGPTKLRNNWWHKNWIFQASENPVRCLKKTEWIISLTNLLFKLLSSSITCVFSQYVCLLCILITFLFLTVIQKLLLMPNTQFPAIFTILLLCCLICWFVFLALCWLVHWNKDDPPNQRDTGS